MPDFSFINRFPVASVIQAAQQKPLIESEIATQQSQRELAKNKFLLDTLNQVAESAGQIAQVRRRQQMAEALAQNPRVQQLLGAGQQVPAIPNQGAGQVANVMGQPVTEGQTAQGSPVTPPFTPGQIKPLLPMNANTDVFSDLIKTAGEQDRMKHWDQINSRMMSQGTVDTPMIMGALRQSFGMPPLQGQSGTPPAPGGAQLASYNPTANAQPPVNQLPQLPQQMNKATATILANLAKIGMANRPEAVMSQADALKAGSVARGTRILDTSKGVGKDTKQQDTLETQAINRLSSIRGDTALKRIEEQRDASIQAFNTIAKIKSENRLPNQLEYYDIIGQMWKARTGSAPTDQAIKDLDAKTLRGDIGKVYQYFVGKAAPRTTGDILSAIQNFADTSGKQADQLHDGYMKTHTIKPTGLDEERWKPIIETQRGLNFDQATKGARELSLQSAQGALTPEEQAEFQRLDQKYGNKKL